jgi:hypothetical protein
MARRGRRLPLTFRCVVDWPATAPQCTLDAGAARDANRHSAPPPPEMTNDCQKEATPFQILIADLAYSALGPPS